MPMWWDMESLFTSRGCVHGVLLDRIFRLGFVDGDIHFYALWMLVVRLFESSILESFDVVPYPRQGF